MGTPIFSPEKINILATLHQFQVVHFFLDDIKNIDYIDYANYIVIMIKTKWISQKIFLKTNTKAVSSPVSREVSFPAFWMTQRVLKT